MTLNELHSRETYRRREFPVAKQAIFLANAAVCPIPRRTAEAMSEYAFNATLGDQEKLIPVWLQEEARLFAAELLGCDRNDVALVGPTSVALSLVANGLSFEPGQNVVYYHGDYPSNAVVWQNLAQRGVELRTVEPEAPGCITVDTLRPVVDDSTRLVALSSSHFVSGYRLDLETIGGWLREKGVLFSVDGIQTLGAAPTRVDCVDFLAADGHKWLLSPCAAGVFYVNPAVQEQLRPSLLGWNNVKCPDFLVQDEIAFEPGARRYEAGSDNFVGLVGLHESLTMLREFTTEAAFEMILGHTRYLREELRRRDYELGCEDDERITGITAFRKEGVDMAALHQKLANARIVASHRTTIDGRSWVRFSPHYYNTRSEIDTALAHL